MEKNPVTKEIVKKKTVNNKNLTAIISLSCIDGNILKNGPLYVIFFSNLLLKKTQIELTALIESIE